MRNHEIPKKAGAIVLGGPFNGLEAVHNLAFHGIPVYVLDHEACNAQFSRYIQRFFRSPHPKKEDDYVNFLIELATQQGLKGSVLFPTNDDQVRVLAKNHDLLSQYYLLTIPPWEITRHLYDKRLTYELADRCEVPIPQTRHSMALKDLITSITRYPVVLKPAITDHFMPSTKKKGYRANDPIELEGYYKKMVDIIDPSEILVQEFIPGGPNYLFSYGGLFDQGEPLVGMTARRRRQHPMDFGRASTFVESNYLPELKLLSAKLLKSIKFTGLAEVEFMYDQIDERFEFIEVNPRLWGWHSIACKAGLDLPYLEYQFVNGYKPEIKPMLDHHVKWVRLATDIPTVALEIYKKRMTLRNYISSLSGNIMVAGFSPKDPLPFIADFLLIPYFMKHRGF